jgi:2'-5' RNA ligase
VPATAIIVPVPEAEHAIERWRREYTEAGTRGMPPHVTLLFPFVDDSVLVTGQLRQIRGMLGAFEPFDFVLGDFGEFAASDTAPPVLYLAPDPAARFEEMTVALVEAFPEYPPYSGEFTTVIPHLTVAHDHEAPIPEIRDDVAPALPIKARAEEAWVMRQRDDGWRTAGKISIGRTAPARVLDSESGGGTDV